MKSGPFSSFGCCPFQSLKFYYWAKCLVFKYANIFFMIILRCVREGFSQCVSVKRITYLISVYYLPVFCPENIAIVTEASHFFNTDATRWNAPIVFLNHTIKTSDVDYNCIDSCVGFTGSVLIFCVSSREWGVTAASQHLRRGSFKYKQMEYIFLYMITLFRISACYPWFVQSPFNRLHCVCFAGWAEADANARPSQLIHDYWLTVRAAIFSRFYKHYMCE